jgi:hypothetical protein
MALLTQFLSRLPLSIYFCDFTPHPQRTLYVHIYGQLTLHYACHPPIKESSEMSPTSPHTQAQVATNEQIATNQPPLDADPPLSITNIPRRSSSQAIKLVSMSRSRSNSIASRRQSSRAGSRQAESVHGQVGQSVVNGPVEVDWDYFNGPFDDFGLDPNTVSHMDAFLHDYTDDRQIDPLAGVSLDPYFSLEGQDYYDPNYMLQPQQSYNPDLVYSNGFDPALLAAQPQYEQLPYEQSSFTQPIDPKLLATPGLTAVPGAADSMPFDFRLGVPFMQPAHSTHSTQLPYNCYPDPKMLPQQQQPYYAPPAYEQQFQQVPVEQAAHESVVSPHKVSKRRRSDAGSNSDTRSQKRLRLAKSSQQESDDERDTVHTIPSANSTGTRKGKDDRRESRDSGTSSSSSLHKPNQDKVKKIGALPEKLAYMPWIRTNGATKGETTRTHRINAEAADRPKYKYFPLPHGNWQTPNGKYSFEYTHRICLGGMTDMDTFTHATMSARQISAYIMKYPDDGLRLWLQMTPADSARRYSTLEQQKCLFEHCPRHIWRDNGTIKDGHYRIAFDEKYHSTNLTNPNKKLDPFDCVAFVHLYCIERFCDFEAICKKKGLVKVDDRVHLPREKSHAKWTMSGRHETDIAHYFIKKCEQRKLRTTDEFKNYPVHQSSMEPKSYNGTLCEALNQTNIKNRTRSQMKQFVNRSIKPGALIVHEGDLDIVTTDKQIKSGPTYKSWKSDKSESKGPFDMMSHYKKDYPLVYKRIQDGLALRARYKAEDAAGTGCKKGKAKAAPRGKKRKVVTIIEDSESEHDVGNSHQVPFHLEELDDYLPGADAESPRGTRSSPRKRARINYADEQNHLVAPQPVHPPTPPPAETQAYYQPPAPYAEQGYYAAQQPRQPSWSQHFGHIGGTLDIDNYQLPEGEAGLSLEDSEFLEMIRERRRSSAAALQRRKSSTLSNGPHYAGITKSSQRSPSLRGPHKPSGGRTASFALQPVSESKEFEIDNPPNHVASTPTRRSARLASRGS